MEFTQHQAPSIPHNQSAGPNSSLPLNPTIPQQSPTYVSTTSGSLPLQNAAQDGTWTDERIRLMMELPRNQNTQPGIVQVHSSGDSGESEPQASVVQNIQSDLHQISYSTSQISPDTTDLPETATAPRIMSIPPQLPQKMPFTTSDSVTTPISHSIPQGTPMPNHSRLAREHNHRERNVKALFDQWTKDMAILAEEYRLLTVICTREEELKIATDDFNKKAQNVFTNLNDQIEALQMSSNQHDSSQSQAFVDEDREGASNDTVDTMANPTQLRLDQGHSEAEEDDGDDEEKREERDGIEGGRASTCPSKIENEDPVQEQDEGVRPLAGEELGDIAASVVLNLPQDEDNPDLEKLMEERPPRNLTGRVTIDFTLRPARGGFALVYQGLCDGIKVAVKETTINVRPSRQSSLRRRIDREIRVWAALRHENILEFSGFAEDHGTYPALISPWCENGTAEDYLRKNVSIHKRLSLVQDVANGLQYLHSLKVIHGDLKPRNVLIGDNETALLCDFGLVALQDWQGPKGMTTTSPYSATALYTPPELFESKDGTNLRATCPGDIYAFGCVMFEFVEAQEPYGHIEHWELDRAKRRAEMPAKRPPDEDGKEFEKHSWNLLEECWDPEPDLRPTSTEILNGLTYIHNFLPLQPAT